MASHCLVLKIIATTLLIAGCVALGIVVLMLLRFLAIIAWLLLLIYILWLIIKPKKKYNEN